MNAIEKYDVTNGELAYIYAKQMARAELAELS